MSASEASWVEEWWAAWRFEDYSWEGLAAKSVQGVGTLQDYWRSEAGMLVQAPNGKLYTRFHLPFRWEDGAPTGKADWSEAEVAAFRTEVGERLAAARSTSGKGHDQIEGDDLRAQFSGVVFPKGGAFVSPDAAGEGSGLADVWHVDAAWAWFEGDVDWRNARFGPLAVFVDVVLSGETLCDHTKFEVGASFYEAKFGNDVSFRDAQFDFVSFQSACFHGFARFERATFVGAALLLDVRFKKEVAFDSACFRSTAAFEEASFATKAWFQNTSFLGSALFEGAVFGDDVTFERARFGGFAHFRRAVFTRAASYEIATFLLDVEFYGASFGGELSFNDVVVGGDVTFLGGQLIEGDERDKEAKHHQETLARKSFARHFSADDSFFWGHADFSNRVFEAPSTFDGAVFLGLAKFYGSVLHQGVSFQFADFDAALAPDREVHGRRPLPWHAAQREAASRYDAALDRLADIEIERVEVQGEEVVRFIRRLRVKYFEAEVKETDQPFWEWLEQRTRDVLTPETAEAAELFVQIREEEARIVANWKASFVDARTERAREFELLSSTEQSRHFAEVERVFRTLKLAMEQSRDHPMEGYFFRRELMARRRRRDRDVPPWERIFSDLYQYSSAFGTSAILPASWLLLVVLPTFAIGYWALATRPGILPISMWLNKCTAFDPIFLDALHFSSRRVFPFGAFDRSDGYGTAFQTFLAHHPLLVGAIATIESALALLLAFLFGLAIRRRFQIS